MFCITYDTTCYADPQRAFDSFMRQLRELFGRAPCQEKQADRLTPAAAQGWQVPRAASAARSSPASAEGSAARDITLSPKAHPKEAAPAPMKRRTIATRTTQTKEITYA